MARKKSAEDSNAMELILALEMLEKEKGVKKEDMLESIKNALVAAYKKNFGKDDKKDSDDETEHHREEVVVDIDPISGAMEVYAKKTVVEEVTDGAAEISLAEAHIIDPKYEVGDIVNVKVTPKNFNRIAAQHARSIIVQNIKEGERKNTFNTFRSKEHEVITGVVRRIEKRSFKDKDGNEVTSNSAIIGLDDRTEVALREKECVPGEQFMVGERVKVYVVEVKDDKKGPRIVVSRTHRDLVKRLMEKEVAEIEDGTVEIKSVARDAGSRTKIAVWAKDPNVDAVGACVGMNGSRINAIVSDLKGEKIDVINWDPDPVQLVANSLSPSKVIDVRVCLSEKSAKVIVPDEQLSLAIGKKGQNASLAVRLTGYKIDIKSESQAEELSEEEWTEGLPYITKGEYVNFTTTGAPKEEEEESAFSNIDEILPEEELVSEDVEETVDFSDFEEISEDEFEEFEEISEDELEELDVEELEEIEELPEE